jgi:spermidine/putrescine-binding protein
MRPTLAIAMLTMLAGCAVERTVDTPPVAYSSASPYAAQASAQRVIVPAPGSYCDEAVAEAQDAAARASVTGGRQDAGRAARTADYAARDCR